MAPWKTLFVQIHLFFNGLLRFFLIIYFILAELGLHCCASLSLVADGGGCSLVAMRGLLIAVASLVAEHGLKDSQASAAAALGLSSCGSHALEHSFNSCGARA